MGLKLPKVEMAKEIYVRSFVDTILKWPLCKFLIAAKYRYFCPFFASFYYISLYFVMCFFGNEKKNQYFGANKWGELCVFVLFILDYHFVSTDSNEKNWCVEKVMSVLKKMC